MHADATNNRAKTKRARSLWLAGGLMLFCMFVLIGSVILTGADSSAERKRAQQIADECVSRLRQSGAEEAPLGDTESVRDAVAKILRFDRGEYWKVPLRRGGTLWVYAAYWAHGKQNIREIAFHTPDHCWVNAGWNLDSLTEDMKLGSSISPVVAKSKQRLFTSKDSRAYVAFWHIFGDEIVDYGSKSVPSNWSLVSAIWRVGLDHRQQQWFIRIHSDRPLNEVEDDPALLAVLKMVEEISPSAKLLNLE